MHAYGGLYVDLDMQCYKPIDDIMGQSDIIFQEEFKYGRQQPDRQQRHRISAGPSFLAGHCTISDKGDNQSTSLRYASLLLRSLLAPDMLQALYTTSWLHAHADHQPC